MANLLVKTVEWGNGYGEEATCVDAVRGIPDEDAKTVPVADVNGQSGPSSIGERMALTLPI